MIAEVLIPHEIAYRREVAGVRRTGAPTLPPRHIESGGAAGFAPRSAARVVAAPTRVTYRPRLG